MPEICLRCQTFKKEKLVQVPKDPNKLQSSQQKPLSPEGDVKVYLKIWCPQCHTEP